MSLDLSSRRRAMNAARSLLRRFRLNGGSVSLICNAINRLIRSVCVGHFGRNRCAGALARTNGAATLTIVRCFRRSVITSPDTMLTTSYVVVGSGAGAPAGGAVGGAAGIASVEEDADSDEE